MLEKVTRDLLDYCKSRNIHISCAESCTGGMIAAALTSVPGSSASFNGGIVSYTEVVKHDVLNVSNEILDGVGVYSADCVCAMASGALHQTKSDFSVATSGVAGPDGGDDKNPVGTLYIGLASSDGSAKSLCYALEGSREEIRQRATELAITKLYEYIVKKMDEDEESKN